MASQSRAVVDGSATDEKYAAKPSPLAGLCTPPRLALAVASFVAFLFFSSLGNQGKPPSQEIHQSIHSLEKQKVDDQKTADGDLVKTVEGNSPTTGASASTIASLLHALKTARLDLDSRLKVGYGKYYEEMFYKSEGVSRGRDAFLSGHGQDHQVPLQQLRRKLKLKLLPLLTNGQSSKFTWVTGGHSATAGHGNFYDESYTRYFEKAAKPVFAALGIELEARNYAMGGTSAGPEIALCSKEIFGTDADVLVWDYGMTDGNAAWRLLLYGIRAQMSSRKGTTVGRPVILAYHTGRKPFRNQAVAKLEDIHIPALVSDDQHIDAVFDYVPDTFGMSDDEINALPEFVRNFKCNSAIENGEPYCKIQKFNDTMCERRKGKTSWHPGWRWHSVMGNIAALFLFEHLEVALQEMEPIENFPAYLDKLQREEDEDYEKFFAQPVLQDFVGMIPNEERDNIDLTTLTLGHNYCHTARLPAEIRHKGILTESSQIGFDSYDKGIGLKDASQQMNPTDSMRLVFSEGERDICEAVVHMDYKDFFYVNGGEDWKSVTIPNESEKREYGKGETLKGMVAFCLSLCPWGKCPAGVLTREDFESGGFQLQVNGVDVTSLTKLDDCQLLRHEGGLQFPLSPEGKLVVRAKVTKSNDSYLRFSAFIVW